MESICRICVTQQGEFCTLDSEITINDVKFKILEIVNKCLHLEANLDDSLPQVLCSECLVNLKLFYQFLRRALKSDEELKSQLCEDKVNYDTAAEGEEEESYELFNYDGNIVKFDDTDERDTDIFSEDTCEDDCLEEKSEGDERIPTTSGSPKTTAIEIARIQEPSESETRTIVYEPLNTRKFDFACDECGRKYSTELKLEQHRQLHSRNKERKCQVCDAVFNSIFEHSEHLKTHYGERNFLCEFCSKAFMSRSSLHSHLLSHYNIKPFKCEYPNCGKEFGQKSILKTHMTLHTGKPIECEICNRRFSRTAHLNIHMRQHNNVRPYACNHCPNKYFQKSHLDRHIASTHMGVRFQCSFCDRAYTIKSSLNIHVLQKHSDTISHYSCQVCEKDFTKQKSLYHHIRTKHPDYHRSNKKK